jgi:hypothetical protein
LRQRAAKKDDVNVNVNDVNNRVNDDKE